MVHASWHTLSYCRADDLILLGVVQQEANRNALVDMLCKDDRAAAMVQTPAFKAMVSELTNHAWEIPCKQVVKGVSPTLNLEA
jgi:hypothetical protein